MSDKVVAGVVTAAAITPICAVCVLGPTVIGSALAGITGWFSGFSPVTTTGLTIIAAILVYGVAKRRRARAAACRRDASGDIPEAEAASLRVHEGGQLDSAKSPTGRDGRGQPNSIRPVA